MGRSYLKKALCTSWKRIMPYYRLLITYLYFSGINFEKYKKAEIYYMHGKFNLFNLNLDRARKMFFVSIRLNPVGRIHPYIGLFLTILGEKIVCYARRRYGFDYLVESPEPSYSMSFTQW